MVPIIYGTCIAGNRGKAGGCKYFKETAGHGRVTNADNPENFVGWFYMGSGQADYAFERIDKLIQITAHSLPG